jgi:hypothetical protein
MSGLTVRDVIGQNVFSMPANAAAADAASAALTTILNTIPWFECEDARVLVAAPQGSAPELLFAVKNFFFNGSVIPTTSALRTAVRTALLSNIDISSIGNINVEDMEPTHGFYQQWPEIEWIDSRGGNVQFKDSIPPGAQIELGKYSKRTTDSGATYPRIGKRFRRFFMLGVGDRSLWMGLWCKTSRKRNVFRARYVWPEPPGTLAPAPGRVGPVAPYGIVTCTNTEQGQWQNIKLLMEGGPSGYGRV